MALSDAILTRLLSLHPKIIDLSLGRMQVLLEKLGNPEKKLPPVIHVAGTNGKGSTVAYLRHIMQAAGLKAHAYTSPHLVKFHERIRVAGELISEADLTALLEECEEVNGGLPITFFEITTAAAFLDEYSLTNASGAYSGAVLVQSIPVPAAFADGATLLVPPPAGWPASMPMCASSATPPRPKVRRWPWRPAPKRSAAHRRWKPRSASSMISATCSSPRNSSSRARYCRRWNSRPAACC